ncbi:magnesium/cobalt transporter CorA [Psychrobacter sp. HD31]|uniref:magnesium/cobalt transporter CorA n=1 Tax=Psychrobacter sp. HD31 TaxID=3112003 RepID=UPI003DA6BC57
MSDHNQDKNAIDLLKQTEAEIDPIQAEEDSFIYGDNEAEAEALETMTVYDPDADRFEDLDGEVWEEVINCYSYSRKTGEQLKKLAIADVNKTLANENQFVWLGLYEPSIETLEQVQQAFDLHELALEDAVTDHQRAKIESYGNDTLFVAVQTAKLEKRQIRYGDTAIFMGKNFIITIRTGPSNSYQPVREHYRQRPDKLRLGPIFVLHAILDFIVDNYMPVVDRLGSYLREQEQSIFSYEFDRDTLRKLYELKSQLVHMRAVILPVQDICNFFVNHKKNELISFFPSSAKPYFRDVNDHLLQSLDAVNGLNEMLSVAMDTYMAVVNMGQNDVVRKLAAWAGILAVPTAIAGIYGMNFANMPELQWRYGYLIIWAIIIMICATLYRQFKKTGWL